MKSSILRCALLILAFLSVLPSSAAETRIPIVANKTTRLTVGNFTKLDVSFGISVNYTVSNASKSTIEVNIKKGPEANLVIKNNGNSLSIDIEDIKDKNKGIGPDITINISGGMLEEIETSLGASVNVLSKMSGSGKCSMDAETGSRISTLGFDFASVDLNTESGSRITVSGHVKCDNLSLEAESGSRIGMTSVATVNADIDSEAASRIEVENIKASRIKASAEAASKINLKGSTGSIDADSESVSEINLTELSYKNIRTNKSALGKIKS